MLKAGQSRSTSVVQILECRVKYPLGYPWERFTNSTANNGGDRIARAGDQVTCWYGNVLTGTLAQTRTRKIIVVNGPGSAAARSASETALIILFMKFKLSILPTSTYFPTRSFMFFVK